MSAADTRGEGSLVLSLLKAIAYARSPRATYAVLHPRRASKLALTPVELRHGYAPRLAALGALLVGLPAGIAVGRILERRAQRATERQERVPLAPPETSAARRARLARDAARTAAAASDHRLATARRAAGSTLPTASASATLAAAEVQGAPGRAAPNAAPVNTARLFEDEMPRMVNDPTARR